VGQLRFKSRLHFGPSHGTGGRLRVSLLVPLLPVLFFLLLATATAAAATAATATTVWLAALLWLRRLFIDIHTFLFHTSCLHE
jgi:predicted membrane metal-binding protein